jgi:hypothetical protein
MLVTNFKLKYVLYKIVCGIYQLADVGRIHPLRERALPDATGFDSQREVTEFALGAAMTEGRYLEFGVFTGGTIRFIAHRIERWLRLSEQIFRVDKWSVCRG